MATDGIPGAKTTLHKGDEGGRHEKPLNSQTTLPIPIAAADPNAAAAAAAGVAGWKTTARYTPSACKNVYQMVPGVVFQQRKREGLQ